MLLPLEARLRRLHNSGADDVVVLPFDIHRSAQEPAEFVTDVLVGNLHAALVVVGENFRFGRKAGGDVTLLGQLGEQHGFEVIPATTVITDDEVVSSTRIRHLVADGDVDKAAALLGRPHRVYGPVVRGDQRGRELGYPTANVAAEAGIAIPADGVYAGWLVLDPDSHGEQHLPAAISVGANVTFDGVEPRVEAYALDYTDLELYDTHVAVEFARRIRPMVKFDGIADLLVAMAADVASAREITVDRRAWLIP
jgi:riboflavin kinase/FMN adenylyltransferase